MVVRVQDSSLISFCDSMIHFGSCSGQQQVLSSKAVVGGTIMYEKDDDEEESLYLFENGITGDFFHTFLY